MALDEPVPYLYRDIIRCEHGEKERMAQKVDPKSTKRLYCLTDQQVSSLVAAAEIAYVERKDTDPVEGNRFRDAYEQLVSLQNLRYYKHGSPLYMKGLRHRSDVEDMVMGVRRGLAGSSDEEDETL